MADTIENGELTGKGGGKSVWSEQEKYSLLLQVVKQFAGTANPKWDQIDLPGRTPKSLQHAWAKIKSEAAEFGGASATNEDGTPIVTKKRATPAKRKSKVPEEGNNGEADENAPTPTKKAKATPKKGATPKKTAANPKKAKKSSPVVVAHDSDDEVGEEVFKETSSVDEQVQAEAGAHDEVEV